MSKSFFIISREIFESAIWRDSPDVLKLWIYLIGTARHDKEPKRFPGFEVKRGELVTSLAKIAENNEYEENGTCKQWSRMKVSRMLQKLVDQGYIEQRCDTYGTHVSICNYDTYQNVGRYRSNTDDTQTGQGCDETVTGLLPYKNDNNGNNGEEEIHTPVPPKAPKVPKVVKIEYAEHVRMTEEEHAKLIAEYGETSTAAFIDRLNTYKGSTGKTYKSDYMTMHSWVIKAVTETKQPQRNGKPNGRTYAPNPSEYEQLAKQYGIGDPATDERAGAVSDSTVRQIRGGIGKDD